MLTATSDFYLLKLGIIMIMILSYRHWKCFRQFVDEGHLAERMSKTRRLFNCAMMSAYNTFYTLYCELHTRPCIYTIALLGGKA